MYGMWLKEDETPVPRQQTSEQVVRDVTLTEMLRPSYDRRIFHLGSFHMKRLIFQILRSLWTQPR